MKMNIIGYTWRCYVLLSDGRNRAEANIYVREGNQRKNNDGQNTVTCAARSTLSAARGAAVCLETIVK